MSEQGDLATWLRQRVRERLYLAQRTVELGNNAEWTEQSSGVLVTSEPTEADAWHGTWVTGDSSLTRLMEANDPRDTITRCEAELAILDVHYILWRHDTSEAYEEFSVVAVGGADKDHGCVTCHYYGQGGVKGYGYCRTVRLLGYGYRFRDGYREEWKP